MNMNETEAREAQTAAQMGGPNTNTQTPVQGDPLDFKPVGIAAVAAAARFSKPQKRTKVSEA